MIRTFGLHWRRDCVNWGRQNHSGTLLGAASRSTMARQIDFREQRGIYVLYSEFETVYIGQTGGGSQRLFLRLRQHLSDHLSERWDRFSWFGTQRVTNAGLLSVDTAAVHEEISAALNILEATAIAIAEPRLNLQRGKWGQAKQYFQVCQDHPFYLHDDDAESIESE